MDFDLNRVAENVSAADTEDLIDRITVYRSGMEPAAIGLIEAELARRGISDRKIRAHSGRLAERAIVDDAGLTVSCMKCSAPAVSREWRMYRVLRLIPVFPLKMSLCEEHGGFVPREMAEET